MGDLSIHNRDLMRFQGIFMRFGWNENKMGWMRDLYTRFSFNKMCLDPLGCYGILRYSIGLNRISRDSNKLWDFAGCYGI